MSAYVHQGRVYFVRCGRFVKIGYSATQLAKRIPSLRRGIRLPDGFDASQPLELIHSIPGCIIRDERRIHGLFHSHHAAGEWFHLTPAFLRQLACLEYVTYRETCLRFRRARAELKRRPSLGRAA